MKPSSLLILAVILLPFFSHQQIVINEGSNSNGTNYILPNGTSPDWIEMYNNTSSSINLQGYSLSDNRNFPQKWFFPPLTLGANQFLTVLATGNVNSLLVNHYETALDENSIYLYKVPTAIITDWYSPLYIPSAWTNATMGIGYGDGDDITDIGGPSTSIYIRTNFTLSDANDVSKAILDIDYDDGFVAYINGVEVARSGLVGSPPTYDELASDHEAQIYQGGTPSSFNLDMGLINTTIHDGVNLLAIEIHNASPNSSDLSCIPYLTFGFGSNTQQFNGTTHPYFSNGAGGEIETNFSISSGGETIYLSNTLGIIVDSLIVPDLEPNMSAGKWNDGIPSQFIFTIPTPNSSNNPSTGYAGYEAIPTIVTNGGLFTNTINVTVVNNSTSNGIVRYTLNGNDPDVSSFPLTGNISISLNSVLKVRCFPNGTNLLPSPTEAETYLFNETSTIPIVSLTINDVDLYGGNGIFDNWWTDWKRACIVEYFDKNGIKQFESKASVKPDGGAGGSRSNPQHSVTVEPANSTFGTGNPIHYPIISEKPYIDDYYGFYLRNGSNFWNQYHQRDATFMRIMRKTKVNSQAYTPVNVFLNGQYFGVYELREKANEGYFKENYGNDMDSLDLLSVSYFYGAGILRTVKGSDTSFFDMLNFISTFDNTSPNYLKYCDNKIDIKNFADYIIGENWIGNTDWIYNNMKLARPRTFDNKWKFFLQDIEWGLGGWTDYNANMFDWFHYSQQPNPYWQIYYSLIQNDTYKNYFINRFADLMNTTLHTNSYTPIVNQMYYELLPEMPRHFALWTGDVPGGMGTYQYQKNVILGQFNNRNNVVRNQMLSEYSLLNTVDVTLNVTPADAGYIKISTIVPDSLPWTGVYFNGNPVKISAVANPGFTFQYWENNNTIPSANHYDSSITLNIPSDDLFNAVFSGIQSDTTLTISEINYHPDSSLNGGNWIELHNYGNSTISLTAWTLKSDEYWDAYEFPDGTVINPGEYLVIAQNINLFQNIYPNVGNVIGNTTFGWNNSGDSICLLAPNEDTLFAFSFNNNDPYPRCADGYGRTLENNSTQETYFSPEIWFCGCIGGSPGQAYFPCQESIIVSEFNLNKTGASYDAGDWIEVFNASGNSINLNGFILKDSKNDHVFPLDGLILAPGEYGLIANMQSLLNTRHSNIPCTILADFPFGISKRDAFRIYDLNGVLVQSVVFDSTQPWSTIPSNSDFTFEYNFTGQNQNLAENWFVGCEGGSPGRAFTPCPILPEDTFAWLYPNPTSNQITIAIDNSGTIQGSTEIVFYDLSGQVLDQMHLPAASEKTIGITIDVSSFANGLYFAKVIQSETSISLPFVKL